MAPSLATGVKKEGSKKNAAPVCDVFSPLCDHRALIFSIKNTENHLFDLLTITDSAVISKRSFLCVTY